MNRYLLFDSNCSLCTEIGNIIARESNGWIIAHTLHDPNMQNLLERSRPNWRWEPTLLEVEEERVHSFTGFAMRIRLIVGLGVRRAWHVWRLVHQPASISQVSTDIGRREFLKSSGAALLGLVLWPGIKLLQPSITGRNRDELKISVEPADAVTSDPVIKRAQNDPAMSRLQTHVKETGFTSKAAPAVFLAYQEAALLRTALVMEYANSRSEETALLGYGEESSGERWTYAIICDARGNRYALVVSAAGEVVVITADRSVDWDCLICAMLCGGLCGLGCGVACIVICGGNPVCAVICSGICGGLCGGGCYAGCGRYC